MPDSLKISPALVAAQQAEAEVAQHLKGLHSSRSRQVPGRARPTR